MHVYELIDTHAHLEEMQDLDNVIERARQAGVKAVVAVGSDYESNNRALEIASNYPGMVYPALGLHPGRLGDLQGPLERELDFIEANLNRAVALGEIGLDYQKRAVAAAGKELQREVLSALLRLARDHDVPAVIHSRYAWRDSYTAVKNAGVQRAVFHWYTGPTNVLGELLADGYFVSATLAAEYHAEHRRAVKETPLEQLLLETDSPVTYQGHRAEPADVVRSLQAAAVIKGVPPERVAAATTANARRVFGIKLD